MAKIVICGDAAVITSTLKLEDIEFIQKYRKSALTLYGGDDGDEPIFMIEASEHGFGTINDYGVEFASKTHDDQGYATVTVICKTDGDIKEYVADKIGGAIAKLNKLEGILPAVLSEVRAERQAIIDSITIAG